jgi:hypothetical protein
MRLTRTDWNPNKAASSGDTSKTSFKCQLHRTDSIAQPEISGNP